MTISLFDVLEETNKRNQVAPIAMATVQPEIITGEPERSVIVQSNVELFNVESRDIYSQNNGRFEVINGKKGLFVDNKEINIVSNKYQVYQPKDIYETFSNNAESHGLQIVKTLTNKNNGGLLISAKYGTVKINSEEHTVNLTFYTSHCGRYCTFLTLDLLRMSCFNQIPVLYKNQNRFILKIKHYTSHDILVNALEKHLVNIPRSIECFEEKAELMHDKKLSFNDFVELYKEHAKLDEQAKQYQTKIDKIKEHYNFAPGQRHLDQSAYKAYQCVTYLNTHERKDGIYSNENTITKHSDDTLKFEQVLLEA